MEEPLDRLLNWEREVLRAESLDAWLERVATTPDGTRARLLVADATHEIRPLVLGDRDQAPAPAVEMVPSLAGLAPQLLSMQGAWRGEYRAADHALLFPGESELRHVVILPLQRAGHLVGLYVAAAADAVPFEGADTPLLDHAADVIIASFDRQLDRARVLRGGLVDPLTGWHSPRYLQARLREELARAQRVSHDVCCLVADVDRLQALNDRLGFRAGDRALREVAARIESEVRSSDAAARFGSGSFLVLMPATAAEQAAPLADRILAAVRSGPVDTGCGESCELRVSIGIAACRPAPGRDRKALSDQLIADAVAAMYRAKQAGGDCCEVQLGTGADR